MDVKLAEKQLNDLEKQIKKLLKNSSVKFSKDDGSKLILSNIKQHIIDVEEAKSLFERYEKLAKRIQNFQDDVDDDQIANMTESVKSGNIEQKTYFCKNDKISKQDRLFKTKKQHK